VKLVAKCMLLAVSSVTTLTLLKYPPIVCNFFIAHELRVGAMQALARVKWKEMKKFIHLRMLSWLPFYTEHLERQVR
jgi:hypothetical protein